MQPYIIFALGRTGSTTLMNLFNQREGLLCLFEPFNDTNANPHLAKLFALRKQHPIEKIVRSLWQGCNGFKHVWGWGGWPFTDDPEDNRRLLLNCGATIVLMHRKNRLHRAISDQTSMQMKMWTPFKPEHFEHIRKHEYQALDIPELRRDMEGAGLATNWARAQLAASPHVRWREITYEDLFAPGLAMDTRMETLQTLFDFIGVGRETNPERLDKMRQLFDPANTGFRVNESYHKIPNIAEVEATLGSVESGFVFEQSSASPPPQ